MNEEEVICVKCGGSMKEGVLNVRDPRGILVTGLRLYWKPEQRAKDAELAAYVCPQCGYVEQYVKDLEKI